MSVRLLLDENLSERLLPMILDRFPDSSHVRLLGLGGAEDLVIWEKARLQGDLPGYRQRRQLSRVNPLVRLASIKLAGEVA